MSELSAQRDTARADNKPRRFIPIASATSVGLASTRRQQRQRVALQMGFFILFVLAPVFDIFRYDLDADHAWLLGMEWRLGLDDFLAGKASALEAAGNIMLRLFVPLIIGAGVLLGVAWKWGACCNAGGVATDVAGAAACPVAARRSQKREPLPSRDWYPYSAPIN